MFSQVDSSHEQDTRPDVRRALIDTSLHTFVLRNGQVRLADAEPFRSNRLLALGECADGECACCRLVRPWVRPKFCAEVAERCVANGFSCLHYLSVGAGRLLADLELLCVLQGAGLQISSVTLVDPAFALPEKYDAALAAFAAFVSPTPVTIYVSTSTMAAAYLQDQDSANVYVQMDVMDISMQESRSLAASTLCSGGLALRLNNRGPRAVATMDIWRRLDTTSSTEAGLRRIRSAQGLPLLTDCESDSLLETLVSGLPLARPQVTKQALHR